LHPPELIERVREEVRAMEKAYGKTTRRNPAADS
jgi:hypothetical protein